MTIDEMRQIAGAPSDASDADVVAAYAALVDDGVPISLPVVEPVSLELARAQCRIEDEVEDGLIEQKIRSAREWVEDYTGRVIAQRTLVAHFRAWGDYLEILARPIVSIDAIAYDGAAGATTYTAGISSIGPSPLRIYPGAAGWPALRAGGGISVAFTAGYDAGEVPSVMIEAVQVLVAGMLNKREGGYQESVAAAQALLYRRRQLAYA